MGGNSVRKIKERSRMSLEAASIVCEQQETVTSAQKDVFYWHKQALEADKTRSTSNLKHAEAIYNINQNEGYKKLGTSGYKSIAEYVQAEFNRGASWTDKMLRVYEKFTVQLKVDQNTLESVGFGKLGKLVSVVNEDNVDEVLEEAKELTQQQIDKKIKSDNGLQENEAKIDEENSRISFSAPKELAKLFNELLKDAKEYYAKDVGVDAFKINDYQGLEIILSFYNLSRTVGQGIQYDLEQLLKSIEKAHKIKIEITREVQDE